jgi:hypothetical protein
MKRETDEWDDVRRLLALKRHEQPPPGYFIDLPHQIMARLDQETPARSRSPWPGWLNRLELRPILVGAYTVGVCGLLLLGISFSQAFSENPAEARINREPFLNQNWVSGMASAYPLHPQAVSHPSPLRSTMNADLLDGPPAFLFDAPQVRSRTALVNFKLDSLQP